MSRRNTTCRVGGTPKFTGQCYPEPQGYTKPQRCCRSLAIPRYRNGHSLGTIGLLLHWRPNYGHHLPRRCLCALRRGVRARRTNGLYWPDQPHLPQQSQAVFKPRPSTQASLGLCVELSLDLLWPCCSSVSCSTNWPPGWMLDLPRPYKPPSCCGFSAAGPTALLRYSGMG